MQDLTPIVKAYDVRGVVDEQLDEDVTQALGRAAALEFAGDTVLVARDMRPSSPRLAEAFMIGVQAQGKDAIDLGLCSTDLLYYASGKLGLPGVMFTASHNPPQYNGLKLCRAGAEPVSLDTGLSAIRDRAQGGDFPHAPRTGERHSLDLLADYAGHVRSFVDVESMRPLKVAVDAGNGMAGLVVPAVLDGLPVEVVPLFFELDGTFPNHPANPIEPENLVDLQAAVVEHGCDVGLAFDGDADRMFCVDEGGRAVSPSLVTALIADRMLKAEPGATILYSLICSRIVRETIEASGGQGLRTRVGHSFIKAVMKETGALFAGEHSGHYYFRENFRADSGLIASVVLLEALSRHDATLSSLMAPYDVYVASGEVNSEVADITAATERVLERFTDRGDADWADGLTVTSDDWWFNLRPSNTEPLLRLNVEAADTPTMIAVRDEVLSVVRGER
jgi:phosphomannomutase